jgi:hypothetical protein
MASRKIDHGKKFEKLVHEAFRHLPAEHPILWERVVDSHDAGNLIRKADCDFKLTILGETAGQPFVFFIECKASINHNSFTDGGALRRLIKSDQVAKMRLAMRAGVTGLFLFHAVMTDTVEVWNAREVCEAWALKRTKFEGTPLKSLHLKEVPTFATHLVTHPRDISDCCG